MEFVKEKDDGGSENLEKIGEFDWILSYPQAKPFILQCLERRTDIKPLNIVEIGCGTSPLAQSIARDFPRVDMVMAVDNDTACIEHMNRLHCAEAAVVHPVDHVDPGHEVISPPGNSRVKYLVWDMLAENSSVDPTDSLLPTGSIQIVLDKGTLDAILVEGSIALMLREVLRMLAPGEPSELLGASPAFLVLVNPS